MAAMLKLAVALTALQTFTAAQTLPTVDLGYNVQQATKYDSTYDAYGFLDVRYAAPPTGQNRFRAPVAPAVNRTVQRGGQDISCPQSNSNLGQEDCLFLDVWTPRNVYNNATNNSTFTGVPVLVWIYGGGYNVGKKSDDVPASFFGREIANKGSGIVWVAMNYRLGAFGWLSGPNFTTSGDANAGLYDQRFALDWVKANVKRFGGNPNLVTLMGESAGGGSVEHQITAYGGSNGSVPFIRAIPQSPGFRPVDDTPRQNTVFQDFLQLLKVSTLDQARALSYSSLLSASNAIINGINEAFGPTVDGKFVPNLPGKLLLNGQFDKNVAIMAGHNFNEGKGFTDPNIKTESDFRNWVASQLPSQVATPSNLDFVENNMYPPIFDGSQAQNYTTQFERADAFTSELLFTCNNYYMNKAAAVSYGYYFIVNNATHGADLNYNFYAGGPNSADPNATLAYTMQQTILNFVKTGNPNGPGLANFPAWKPNSIVRQFNITGSPTAQDPASNTRCAIFQTAL